MEKVCIFVIDGCGPAYLTRETAPSIYALAEQEGSFAKTVEGAVPTVTNVNHACIMSGLFPEDTRVVGNYYYNRQTGEQGFIEGKGFMKAPTVFEAFHKAGGKTALLTVKGKILQVFGADVDLGISVQNPDPELLSRLNLSQPPQVQSPESTPWIFEAAYQCIRQEDPDLIYCTTNDFIMHHYGPETEEARQQIRVIDEYVKKIRELNPERQIYITADHGMNRKTELLNLQNILDDAGLHVVCVPPLKDRYIENHIYQEGGILYLYLGEREEEQRLLDLLASRPEVEAVLPAEEAARRYRLPKNEIGDYAAFAAKECAFGEVEGHALHTDAVRTHGSLYEREVPLIALNSPTPADKYAYSRDIVRNLKIAK